MNESKFFFYLIRKFLKIGLTFGTTSIGCIYIMHVLISDTYVSFYGFMTLMSIGLFTIVGMSAPKVTYNMLQDPSLENYMISLLPISPLKKYVIIVMSALIPCLSVILTSLPLEIIGSVLTATYSPGTPIEIGGLISFLARNGIFTLLLVVISIGVFCSILFRGINKASTAIAIICLPFCGYWLYIHGLPPYDLHEAITISDNVINLFATIIFLTSGYYIFKRWQIANDGVLMI